MEKLQTLRRLRYAVLLLLSIVCAAQLKAQITVNATIGTASASYTSFNAAITAINNGTHKGSIRIRVHNSVVETAATSLEASGTTASSYTAILITPADTATVTKTISISATAVTLFTLAGADNVTIDGRPNVTGTNNLLTFNNPNNVGASHVIALSTGARANTFKYCTISSGSIGTVACSALRLTTGANNLTNINHCVIDGGNLGVEINGTNGTPNDSTTLFANRIINQKATAVRLAAGVGRTFIDSNLIYHTIATTTSGYQCYNISQVEATDTVYIYRTRAYDIQTSAANFIHGIFLSPSVASGAVVGVNNSFILGTTTYPNTLSQVIRGVLFTGTITASLILEHNTIRVGGTHITANGNPTSVCMIKTNTSVASVFTFRNNLCINNRTGSTSQHVGIFVASPTAGTNTIDYNTYKGSLYHAVWVSTLYNDLATYKTTTAPNEQHSVFGIVDFMNDVDPDIKVVSFNTTEERIAGTPSSITTDILGNPRNNIVPRRGAIETAIPTALSGNTISSNQSFYCTGTAATLTGSSSTGGYGTYAYQWFSAKHADSPYVAISGANAINYDPGTVSATRLYKRVVFSGYTDTSAAVTITINNAWTGNVSNDFTVKGNWCLDTVPTAITDEAYFPTTGGNYPALLNANKQIGKLTLQAGAALTVTSTLKAGGDIVNNGIVDVKGGILELNAAAPQTITGIVDAGNIVQNGSGTTITAGTSKLNVYGTYTSLAGQMTTNGNLVLKSTPTGTGRIAAISPGNIIGAITTEVYIPGGRRAYRFLGHPFMANLTMGSLIDDIYITGDGTTTGAGGATTGSGFDATQTNAASSWWYDAAADAWKAFTSTTDASWTAYRGARIMVRGNRYQPTTLTGSNITPAADTLDISGNPNIGNVNVSLTNANKYHLLGNPYPSPVDIGAVLGSATNIGTQYWVWDANAATRGAYVTKLVAGGSYAVPMNAAFFVRPTATTTINFTEAHKVDTTGVVKLFRNANGNNTNKLLQLQVDYNNYFADNLYVGLDATALTTKDALDGEKLLNQDINLYTLTTDQRKLSLDIRPDAETETIIPVGFTTTVQGNFTIRVINAAEDWLLKDKLLNTLTPLTAASTYTFAVTADAATQGSQRFELVHKAARNITPALTEATLKLLPNPASGKVQLRFTAADQQPATITISDAKGSIVRRIDAGTVAAISKEISLQGLAKGSYYVTVNSGNHIYTEVLQVQ